MRRAIRVMVALATVASLMAASTVASAKPPAQSGVVERAATTSGYVYSGDGVHVVTGPPLEEGCLGLNFPTPVGQFIYRPNGTEGLHHRSNQGIYVFDDMGIENVLDWLFLACTSDVAPEPLASGMGTVTYHERTDKDGVLRVHNKVVGKVTTAEGKRVHLSTFAAYFQEPGAIEPTLTALRVNYGG